MVTETFPSWMTTFNPHECSISLGKDGVYYCISHELQCSLAHSASKTELEDWLYR